jgi:uncharacterized protein (TIGR02099 family)
MNYESGLQFLKTSLGWTIFSLIVLAAIYVSFGKIVFANIPGYKSEILEFVSTKYQLDLEVGEVRSVWNGLNPSLSVTGIVIGKQGEPQSFVEELEIELGSLESLVEWNWVITHFRAHGISTKVAQNEDGTIKIAGVPARDGTENPKLLVDLLVYTEHFVVSGLNARLSTDLGEYYLEQQPDDLFELITNGKLKTVSVNFAWKRKGTNDLEDKIEHSGSLQFVGEFSGDPRLQQNFHSRGYVNVTPLHLHDVLSRNSFKAIRLGSFLFGGEFWYRIDDSDFDVRAELNVPELQIVQAEKKIDPVTGLSANFRILGSGINQWHARLNQLRFMQAGNEWQIANIRANSQMSGSTQQILARSDSLDLGKVYSLIMGAGAQMIPERTRTMITTMAPAGKLRETYLDLKLSEDTKDFRLLTRLQDGKLNAYLGSPMIDNLDAVISVGTADTWIDIHNSTYHMHFASLFDEAWPFDSASGRLNIGYVPGMVTIASDLLEVKKAGMTVNGMFHLNLGADRSKQTWALMLGIREGEAAEKSPYLPNKLSPALAGWLNRSIVSGRLLAGGLIFHGSLSADAPADGKLHEYFFKVENSVLDYHPDWPRLTELEGIVDGGNWGVSSTSVTGILNGSSVVGNVLVPFDESGKASFVEVDGTFRGLSQGVLNFIGSSPVADMTNRVSADWRANGQVEGKFDLKIPINNSVGEDGSPLYNFDGSISGEMLSNELTLPSYNLTFGDLSTKLLYTPQSGLTADRFDASIFGYPISGHLYTKYNQEDSRRPGVVQLDFSAISSVLAIKTWANLPLLGIAKGETGFVGSLVTPFGPDALPAYLILDSQLQGVEIGLPDPLGKISEEQVPLRYKATFLPELLDMEIEYGADVKARLLTMDGALQKGLITFNQLITGEPVHPGLAVKGVLDSAIYDEWMAFNEQLAVIHEESTGASYDDEFGSLIKKIKLEVGSFQFKDTLFKDIDIEAKRADQRWDLVLNNDKIAGDIRIFDKDRQPMEINLDYLHLESKGEDVSQDPLASTSLDDLQAMKFRVNDLYLDRENYGSWQFNLSLNESSVVLQDLYASVKGMLVHGVDEQGALLEWTIDGETHQSKFDGILSSPEIATALAKWGFAPSIEGETFRFGASTTWSGSPAMISRDIMEGRVSLESDRGRFVQATGGGAMKLLGIFDFASLARRFRFDFTDVADEGYQFNEIEGEWRFDKGRINVTEPITIKGSSSSFKIGGEANLMTGAIDGDMIVTLPVSRNLPWYSAVMVSPVVGAGVFLVQKVFEDQIDQMSSAKYKVTGTIDEPIIEFSDIFSNKVREGEESDETLAPAQQNETERSAEMEDEKATRAISETEPLRVFP